MLSLLLVVLSSMAMEQDSPDKIEQLLEGIRDHDLRIVSKLLQQDIDVDCEGKDGKRPIDTLIEYSREYIANDDVIFIKVLARAKELNYVSRNGNTPLYNAVYYAKNCVKFLLKAGADVNAQNTAGQTALMACAKRSAVRRCVDLRLLAELFAAGAQIDIQDNQNATVLDYSMHEDLKPFLLAKQLTAKKIAVFKELKKDTKSFVYLLPSELMAIIGKMMMYDK